MNYSFPMQQQKPWKNSLVSPVLLLAFVAVNVVNKHVGGDPFREGKMIIFLLAALFAGCVWVAQRFDPWLAAVMGIASAEWAWKGGTFYGILPTAGVLGFLYLGHVASRDQWLTHWILRASTWIQVVFCLAQMLRIKTFGGNDPYFDGLIYGSMGHPVVVGAWFAAVAPLAWFYWSKAEFLVCAALALWSGSTMAIVALLAGGGYVWVRRVPSLALLAIPAALLLLLGVYLFPEVEFFSISGRQIPWRVAYEHILQSPWVGYSPGSWDGMYETWKVPFHKRWNFVHNDWLQLCFELGIPAFCIAMVAAYSVLRKALLPYGACLAALLVNALGNFPFHLPGLSFLFVVALALGITDNEEWPGSRS